MRNSINFQFSSKLRHFAFEIITLLEECQVCHYSCFMRQKLPQGNVDEIDMIEVLEQAVLYYLFIFYHGDDFAFDNFE